MPTDPEYDTKTDNSMSLATTVCRQAANRSSDLTSRFPSGGRGDLRAGGGDAVTAGSQRSRCGGRAQVACAKRTRLLLFVASAMLCTRPAWSADLVPVPAADHFEFENVANLGSFGSHYTDLSVTASPFTAYYDSGFKFRLTASDTSYSYFGDATKTFVSRGEDIQTDLLVGYGFQFDRWSLLLLAGPSFLWSWQTPGDSSSPFSQSKVGAKASVSVYGNPRSDSMVYAQASYSSASDAYYAQAKYGRALWSSMPHLFIGPEISAAGRAIDFNSIASGFQEWRAGAFLSGLTLGPLLFGVSAGYLNDRQQRSGAYLGTSVRTTF
jgi:Cellulose biosynthesis protein BcsS